LLFWDLLCYLTFSPPPLSPALFGTTPTFPCRLHSPSLPLSCALPPVNSVVRVPTPPFCEPPPPFPRQTACRVFFFLKREPQTKHPLSPPFHVVKSIFVFRRPPDLLPLRAFVISTFPAVLLRPEPFLYCSFPFCVDGGGLSELTAPSYFTGVLFFPLAHPRI